MLAHNSPIAALLIKNTHRTAAADRRRPGSHFLLLYLNIISSKYLLNKPFSSWFYLQLVEGESWNIPLI